MKCPICGETLRPGKKDPNYLLCYTCRKKYKAPGRKMGDKEEQKYSNIPPKSVREKREKEMKKAYDDMLLAEENNRKRKRKKPDAGGNTRVRSKGYEEEYQEEKVSKLPIVILGLAIVVVTAVIVYMLLK